MPLMLMKWQILASNDDAQEATKQIQIHLN